MSHKQKTVDHLGKVVEITRNDVKVSIISHSACASCHASGVCGMADTAEKTVAVTKPNHGFILGQDVKVILKQSMGFKALFLGYLIPFMLVVTLLIAFNSMGFSELKSGLFSISALVPYYFVLYLLRDKISRSFNFDIEPIL
ncbi:MAG TPA: SoxR reducing system RseC family protein [Tenuifilaceae bacterium]|nr:SoxR reducing system RseC family protein [Tenuifilaceae bacterium]HPE19236.1 SoxR reducing system RseC family protein [Tenuifilaceae bacterium]HPJ46683.1 SoxR reducing system RseC family protein [Tenuifilaceae bacterium]HPQ34851.1 SoxR reducing system RseC family protein [Tenuifilaceae bacterium]HRX67469.1 SoxR reducing system RseC family protein [Tenuifilaceae bacterium]